MIYLRSLLSEILLSEIDSNTTLYHRSLHEYKIGDIIDPELKFGDGSTHWLASITSERALELYRQKNFPSKPSRFKCVYCSIIPNSAFVGKGYLYEVKPIGNWFMTFANYINKINDEWDHKIERDDEYSGGLRNDKFGRMDFPSDEMYEKYYKEEYHTLADYRKAFYAEKEKLQIEKAEWMMDTDFDRYWNPHPSHNIRVYKKWVEVLCDKVKVVGVGDPNEFKFFKKGDTVKFKKDITVEWNTYQHVGDYIGSKDKKEFSTDEIENIKKKFNAKMGGYNGQIPILTIPADTVATVHVAAPNHTPLPNANDNHHIDQYSPYRMLRIQPKGYDFYVELAYVLKRPKELEATLEKIS